MEELNVVNDTQEPVVEVQPEAVENVEATEPATEVTESVDAEVATAQESEVEKPVQSKEENAKYAEMRRKMEAEKSEAIEKAAQEARDKQISEMYGDSHGIHTEADYKKAYEREQQRKAIEEIKAERNYTDDEAQEIFEARQIKAEREQEKQKALDEQADKEKIEADNKKFLEYFEKANGKAYDPQKDKLPDEVWESVNNGESLKYAYMEYELSQLRKGKEVQDKNLENSEAAVGSVKGDGVLDADFISEAEYDSKKSDQRWVMRNLDKLNKSRQKW